jgi:hypothetical protein
MTSPTVAAMLEVFFSKPWFDLMHWNVSIGHDKWPIFGRFLKLFPLKRPVGAKEIPPIWQTSVDDVTASPLRHATDRLLGL